MHWLSQNYQWVFSGIGVLVLALLLDRWIRRKSGLPKLKVEVRQVCFDDLLEDFTQDLADFTVDRYIFVRVWLVNTKDVTTAVKEWKLTYSQGGKRLTAQEVTDFSKWHQHVKWKEHAPSGPTVIKDARNPLAPFPSQALHHGVPSEGWVCFKATGVSGMSKDDSMIELYVVDSFGKKYRVKSPAPLACKGNIINPDLLW